MVPVEVVRLLMPPAEAAASNGCHCIRLLLRTRAWWSATIAVHRQQVSGRTSLVITSAVRVSTTRSALFVDEPAMHCRWVSCPRRAHTRSHADRSGTAGRSRTDAA
jgi:hypothetical protein